jgi:cyclic pyranopterin phosphate synthase
VRYRFEGALGEIGFISPLTHHFCQVCNRLRLTAKGHLRPCLLSDQELDLKGPMRAGATDRDLEKIFAQAADHKPRSHHLNSKDETSLSGGCRPSADDSIAEWGFRIAESQATIKCVRKVSFERSIP